MTISEVHKRQRGVAAVELAILLPIFLILLALPLYYARVFWHYSVAEKAAYDAVRYLSSVPLTEMRNPNAVSNSIKVAQDIIDQETSELNPGMYQNHVTLLCDSHTCDGFTTPAKVQVVVRLYMTDIFFSEITAQLLGDIVITADVSIPYLAR